MIAKPFQQHFSSKVFGSDECETNVEITVHSYRGRTAAIVTLHHFDR